MVDESQVVCSGAHCTPLRAQWCNGLPILEIRCTKDGIDIYLSHREEKSLKNSRQSLMSPAGKGDFHEKMFAFLSWKPGRWQEATKGKNTYSSSLACFVLPTNALTPTLFSLRALSRSRKQARALSLFPQPLRWVDTYSRLIGPVTAPLGTNPVSTPLGEPSIYAAWRAQYLRRLARAQYLRRLGYNALSSLIIL